MRAAGDQGDERPGVITEYPGCSHLDYILELVTSSDSPPVVAFLQKVMALAAQSPEAAPQGQGSATVAGSGLDR